MKSKFILCLALIIGGGWFCLWFLGSQLFQDYRLARFPSPTYSTNEAWFMDGGVLDHDLLFLVKLKNQKPQGIANLCWFPDCDFSFAQWSKDGQVIVCSVKAKAVEDKPIMVAAFDFSKNKPINPLWLTISGFDNKPKAEWLKQEGQIKDVVAAHGGLSDPQIDNSMVINKEKTLWFWQVPKL
jgi:hypothetical protein